MKYTDEQLKEMIETDFRFIVDWQGDEFGEEQEKELKRLIETNLTRFRNHLEELGEISEFQYK